jgi:hypothetical protein
MECFGGFGAEDREMGAAELNSLFLEANTKRHAPKIPGPRVVGSTITDGVCARRRMSGKVDQSPDHSKNPKV